jgi:hypothetical protein
MTTRTCPNCRTEIFGDPQACPYCQNGLREGRMNLPGRMIFWLVLGGTLLAVIALVYLVWGWFVSPDKSLSSGFFLFLKVGGVGVLWFIVFQVAQVLEGFARLK